MAAAKHWIAVSAISALGVGLLASGAIGVANAMPLVDSTTTAEVPPISTLPGDVKGSADSGDVSFPVPSSSPEPASVPTVEPAPPVAPQPVAPAPPTVAGDSPVSLASPVSVDDD